MNATNGKLLGGENMAYQVKNIRHLYLTLLQRYPSVPEVTYWLHFLAAGGTEQAIRLDLVETHEFQFEITSRFRSRHKRQPNPAEILSLREKAVRCQSLDEVVA